MDDTEGVSFPGGRPIIEPTIFALPGGPGGSGIVFSGVCQPKRKVPKPGDRTTRTTVKKATQTKKQSKRGASKKKK